MARTIIVVSVEKEYDVRDYTLVSFGGAGGLHVCELAERLLPSQRVTICKPRVYNLYLSNTYL